MGSPLQVVCGIVYTSLSDLRENEGYLGQESLLKKVSDHIASTLDSAVSFI